LIWKDFDFEVEIKIIDHLTSLASLLFVDPTDKVHNFGGNSIIIEAHQEKYLEPRAS